MAQSFPAYPVSQDELTWAEFETRCRHYMPGGLLAIAPDSETDPPILPGTLLDRDCRRMGHISTLLPDFRRPLKTITGGTLTGHGIPGIHESIVYAVRDTIPDDDLPFYVVWQVYVGRPWSAVYAFKVFRKPGGGGLYGDSLPFSVPRSKEEEEDDEACVIRSSHL